MCPESIVSAELLFQHSFLMLESQYLDQCAGSAYHRSLIWLVQDQIAQQAFDLSESRQPLSLSADRARLCLLPESPFQGGLELCRSVFSSCSSNSAIGATERDLYTFAGRW